MNITLTGASGFIGGRLIKRLVENGHSPRLVGRSRPVHLPDVAFMQWDAAGGTFPDEALDQTDAIIHLAGEPVAQRWNPEVKSRIHSSRVAGTSAIVQAIARRASRPHTMVSASAIGYYGDRGDEVLDEQSVPGDGFLPEVCIDWEREAQAAGRLGVRVAMLRIGIVLGKEGGALKQMLPPFRLGVGGPTASGKQWMSWIHADDLVNAIVFCIENRSVYGPLNATAPNPVRNAQFAVALGAALKRPAVIHTPVFALKMMLGEAAQVILASQRVIPAALQQAGFTWRHPQVDEALKSAV